MEHKEFTNIFLGGCESTEKMSIFTKILGYDDDDFELYSPILLAKDFIENGVTDNGIEKEKSESFKKAFIWIAGEGWKEVLEVFFASPIFMSILDPQSAKDALIQAANNEHVDVVKKLIENGVFKGRLESPLYSSDVEKKEKFLDEFKEVACLIIKKSIVLGHSNLLQIILDNERIRKLFSKDEISNFLPELEKMHGQSGYPYEQIQNILSFKKSNSKSRRNNKCILF